jgi:endogenous inhibitor of DNA gyrase (YacG/DUF329 family)
MAKDQKDKEHTKLHQIYKAGDKYHCAECGSEVHWGKDCPECKLQIDWKQIDALMRR